MKVAEFMTRNLYTVEPSDSLEKAKHMMSKHKVRHLPVKSGQKLVGILSLTDVMRLSFGNTYAADQEEIDSALFEAMDAGNVMREEPVFIDVNADLTDAANVFVEREFHALPVMDSEELVGIITTTDVIRAFMELAKK
jgi:CBS domain-containing protein